MSHELNIFVEQLQEGLPEKISLTVPSGFFDLNETDLTLDAPVSIKGEIYVTDHHLILHLEAQTHAKMPCAVCNNPTDLSLEAKIYESLPLSELESTIFDYSSFVKEELLLQIPLVAECQNNCPERLNLKPFLKEAGLKKAAPSENTHFPFADL
jgi:uncharacterized metal-binding protein YceD (DUF177 family)